MKDWKTYAIVALAAWCAWLTLHEPKERIVKTECVDELMREAFKWSNNSHIWGHFKDRKDRNTWDNEECLRAVIDSAKYWAKRRQEDMTKSDGTPNAPRSK